VSFNGLCNIQSSVYHIPDQWENDLYEVISYVNEKLPDNFTIVTCYALPISYFTTHPVIESLAPYGIMNLLWLPRGDVEEMSNYLIEHNTRYLLFPNPDHSYYPLFENLSSEIPILNTDVISETPFVVLLNDFSKFKLYKLITQYEVTYTYRYFTLFKDGWIPLNNCSILTRLNTTVVLHTLAYKTEVIADDGQNSFWRGARANPEDELLLIDDVVTKVGGIDSLKIYVNGTGNVIIRHPYESPQDWSSYKALAFYIHGSNTSKPIIITFHTESWQDYYYVYIEDNFVGWKNFAIPLSSFNAHRKPSWNKINYIEILFGERTATYYLDQIRLEGYIIGLQGHIPPITTSSPEVKIALSISGRFLESPILCELTSLHGNGELTAPITYGVNLITIPSEILRGGATIRLYYHQSNIEEELTFNYLGVLSDS